MLNVPHYDELSRSEIVQHASQYLELMHYVPHDRDVIRVGRGWLCNMIHSVVGNRFREWVH